MKLESIQRTWLTLAVVQLAFALTVMGEIQNAQFTVALKSLIGAEFLSNTPDSVVASWGILLLSLLLTATLGLIPGHARQTGKTWRSRLPFRVLDSNPDSGPGVWFARIALLLGVLVPLWTLGHCWRVLHNEGILCTEKFSSGAWTEIAAGWRGIWLLPDHWTFGKLFDDGYRLAGEDGCGIGTTTFFPLLEPVLFLVLTIWAIKNLVEASLALIGPRNAELRKD